MSRHNRKILLALALLSSAFLWGGTSQAIAREGSNQYRSDRREHRNSDGYWDQYGNYHRYGYRNHHRGYWNQHNGIHFWINVG